MKHRIQNGSSIVEVSYSPGDENMLLIVSKERYDDDKVIIPLPRHLSKALGHLLLGDE